MKKAKLIVGAGESCPDILYATELFTPDPFIFYMTETKKAAVLSALEYNRAKSHAPADLQVYSNTDFKCGYVIADLIEAIGREEQIDEFEVPQDFPLYLAEILMARKLRIRCCPHAFWRHREFKSEAEILKIKQALQITEQGLRRGWEVLGESSIDNQDNLVWHNRFLTSEILRSEINMELMRHAATPQNTIVASGIQGAEPHNPGYGVIKANTPVVMDIFPRSDMSGYFGDLTRTSVKGKAAPVVKKAFEAVCKARDGAKKLLKTGVIPAEVHRYANCILEEAGFPTGRDKNGNYYGFFHGLGHGVGLEIHEAPRLSPGNSKPLSGNEIITVEPGVYYPEWGGIRMEDMVCIREKHADCLTEIGDTFEIE